jgi:hypothetical protein
MLDYLEHRNPNLMPSVSAKRAANLGTNVYCPESEAGPKTSQPIGTEEEI